MTPAFLFREGRLSKTHIATRYFKAHVSQIKKLADASAAPAGVFARFALVAALNLSHGIVLLGAVLAARPVG
jgi:hypothetical protein